MTLRIAESPSGGGKNAPLTRQGEPTPSNPYPAFRHNDTPNYRAVHLRAPRRQSTMALSEHPRACEDRKLQKRATHSARNMKAQHHHPFPLSLWPVVLPGNSTKNNTATNQAIQKKILPHLQDPIPTLPPVLPTNSRFTPSGFPVGKCDALVLLLPLLRRLVASVQLHGRPAHVPLDERVLVPGSFVTQAKNKKQTGPPAHGSFSTLCAAENYPQTKIAKGKHAERWRVA